jgi:hypothetical protein
VNEHPNGTIELAPDSPANCARLRVDAPHARQLRVDHSFVKEVDS